MVQTGIDNEESIIGGLTVGGSQHASKVDAGAADYNPSTLTSDYIITVDTSAAPRAVIISTEDKATGSATNPRIFIIKDIAGNAGTNNITISLESSGNIDGQATAVIDDDYDSIALMVDGTNGYIIYHETCSTVSSACYAEMYYASNEVATIIETANTPICLINLSSGSLQGWTFTSGTTSGITAYEDGTGKVIVVSAGHGLVTGDIISIRGVASYKGVWSITKTTDDRFTIPAAWAGGEGASDWEKPSYLTAGAGSAGTYLAWWNLSNQEAGLGGSIWDIVLYINTTPQTKTKSRRRNLGTIDYPISGNGILTIAEGDKVFITEQSNATNNITNHFGNVMLYKL